MSELPISSTALDQADMYEAQRNMAHNAYGVNRGIKLSLLDRLLTPLILLAMIIGIVAGILAPDVQDVFNSLEFRGVSLPIAIGLIVMMWPILTKVKYEALPKLFVSSQVWIHIILSIVFNWIVGPCIMLALAWAALPDLPTYRTGVIMVGLARCIAMVMIWNELAGGNRDYCAVLVLLNSILQICLYSPLSLLFVKVIGGVSLVKVSYDIVAISVLIYLGIPLIAGIVTRILLSRLLGTSFFESRFLPVFSSLSLLGLLYVIIIIFAYQGRHIVHHLGPVARVFVPMILYFTAMWGSCFVLYYYLTKWKGRNIFGYQMAVAQSFTAGSNNFELAIAVCVAVWGAGSDQALAATIGPLVEVPVLLSLTWLSIYFHNKLDW